MCIPIHIFVLCEGATEETFIKTVLNRHLQEKNIYLTPILLNGVSKYNKIKKELILLCKSNCYVTTMLDYYGLPSDTPNKDCACDIPLEKKIKFIENGIKEDIQNKKLIPNLIVHEFEALLFSNPECFSFCGVKENQINQLKKIKNDFNGLPELINNSPQTAPSKRIIQTISGYQKIIDGCLIAEKIGLSTIRKECTHFNEWIEKLESLN